MRPPPGLLARTRRAAAAAGRAQEARFRVRAGGRRCTLAVRFPPRRHRRGNALYHVEDQRVPRRQAAAAAAAGLRRLPPELMERVLRHLRVPRRAPLKAWLRLQLRPGDLRRARGGLWAPARAPEQEWPQVMRCVRRALLRPEYELMLATGKKRERA